ncbi:zinc finger HIT domain-containing protein 3 [Aplysia californica]|uniref:Zinc finger HIT domain-containing protein 3 n=1 Tax=Aplysia californica TaxID=6500 RepID=A0ABM1A0Z1_APLCA|nr:zinc finger HIT domain-containing protein 3 [Aplysia californica]
MPACIVCSTEAPKYRCPQCLEQYCSVKCCKGHKELCQKQPKEQPNHQAQIAIPSEDTDGLPPNPRRVKLSGNDAFEDDAENEDKVSEILLQQLGKSEELKSTLCNPHLRAIMENLVNSDQPGRALSLAMQEPIFKEFADVCLSLVDRDNPNLEPEVVS